jgi:hypothetical protein
MGSWNPPLRCVGDIACRSARFLSPDSLASKQSTDAQASSGVIEIAPSLDATVRSTIRNVIVRESTH